MSYRIPRLATWVLLLAITPAASADIFVTPPEPLSAQNVTIELTNQYTSEASIQSASIVQNGNQFLISQTIELACPLPNAPILTSEFEVGQLPPGEYQITAEIELVSPLPNCGGQTVMEMSSFTVTGTAVAVPSLGTVGLVLLAVLLMAFGLRRLDGADYRR